MIDLPPEQYDLVKPLIHASPLRSHRALMHAILEGYSSGRIFVNQTPNPVTALLCNLNGFYFALGAPDDDMLWEVGTLQCQGALSPEASVLFGESPAWQPLMQKALPPLGGQPAARIGFDWRPAPNLLEHDPAARLPAGFSLQPITTQMAQGILDGTATQEYGIDPWFIRVAGGPRAYAERGLGMAILTGETIASICGYCGLGDGEAELEVGTVPAYRGQGLATLVSLAFLRQCRQKGWLPAYSVARDNLPSLRVAAHLGFVPIEEISGFALV